jgi:phospholipid/cholesterol/gamma-HCH transport system substrate-binding protein
MKSFSERNPAVIGAIGVAVSVGILGAALNYDKLPLFSAPTYSAYLAEAGGLALDSAVQVCGLKVGHVSSITLDGSKVLVEFSVEKGIDIGDRTEAAVKTKTLLGAKILELTPRGDGQLGEPIPLERTTSAYELPKALGDITNAISGLKTDQLSNSLKTLSDTFADSPPELKIAIEGAGRLSQALNARDSQLRSLLVDANKVTTVLQKRTQQIVSLVGDSNSLLVELQTQSAALDQLSGNVTALSGQLTALIADNREPLKPALEKLNGVLTILDNHKAQIQESIKLLNSVAMSTGEAVSSGPYYKAMLRNLPGQFVQPFVDAAFSDLGLDPNTLLPSQLTDPPTGQPGTPPLPVPFPRTGQGGEPNLTLPGAITGNPGDPRYPYREPLPAPAPGGPPPGPPAAAPPGVESIPEPTPSPVFAPAPGESPANASGGGQ